MELRNIADIEIDLTNNEEDVIICEENSENWENKLIAETVQGNVDEENKTKGGIVILLDVSLRTMNELKNLSKLLEDLEMLDLMFKLQKKLEKYFVKKCKMKQKYCYNFKNCKISFSVSHTPPNTPLYK